MKAQNEVRENAHSIYIYNFRERGREKERERNVDWLPCARPKSGMWPTTQAWAHQELSQWPFGLWDDAQPTEPHQSEHIPYIAFVGELQGLWLLCPVGLTEAVSPFGHCCPLLHRPRILNFICMSCYRLNCISKFLVEMLPSEP